MSLSPGNFAWYELLTSDPPAAEAFYTAVLGWRAADAGMPGMAYTLMHVGDVPHAGLMALPPEARAVGAGAHWLGYVGVADVDASARHLAEAGGTVHRPPDDIPGVGRFAPVSDPQGAAFVLFRGHGADGPPPIAPGTPGTVGWHELHATEIDTAFAFYGPLLGWKKGRAHDMGPLGLYQIFGNAQGTDLGGLMNKEAPAPKPYWLFYFNVDGIDAAVARVQAAGGQALMAPHQVPEGAWIAPCLDPQGAAFALVSMAK